MIVYVPNGSMLYTKEPIGDRLRQFAEAGFSAFELMFPRREGLEALEAGMKSTGLPLTQFNMEPDEAHPKGFLTDPDGEKIFLKKLAGEFELAHRLHCSRIHVMVGQATPGLSHDAQKEIVTQRLRLAAPLAEHEKILLQIEALNTTDNPGFFLDNSKDGVDIVKAVNSPWVRFQYDVYHMQIMEGNIITTIRENLPWIAHIQVADVPGRYHPGTGEINYPNVLQAIKDMGYNGYVGLEYKMKEDGSDPFAWLPWTERGGKLVAAGQRA